MIGRVSGIVVAPIDARADAPVGALELKDRAARVVPQVRVEEAALVGAGSDARARARGLRERSYAPQKCRECAEFSICGGGCPLYLRAKGGQGGRETRGPGDKGTG